MEIDPTAWDKCANPDTAQRARNPFLSHRFLRALEDSGCVGPGTGWQPQHLRLEQDDGTLAGVMPCYVKTHSRGEYVFDHAWAHAYQRFGLPYYPKLQVAVPFTPVPGRRILVPQGPQRRAREEQLLRGAIDLCTQNELSSLHLTFVSKDEWTRLGRRGFLRRSDQQFHWNNQGFEHFNDFLASLSSRKRKAVRRERREALCANLSVEWITGDRLTEAHWDAFYRFYMDTGHRKWGTPYLNRRFFSLIGDSMRHEILLIMARRDDGRYIAGALNFIGADTLYGRYWGAIEHHRFLHFEICYYQAIEFAITHGLARVEAGAQGEHKLARGYLPTPTYSLHYFTNPAFAQAVARYLAQEREAVDEEINELLKHSPFRKDRV